MTRGERAGWIARWVLLVAALAGIVWFFTVGLTVALPDPRCGARDCYGRPTDVQQILGDADYVVVATIERELRLVEERAGRRRLPPGVVAFPGDHIPCEPACRPFTYYQLAVEEVIFSCKAPPRPRVEVRLGGHADDGRLISTELFESELVDVGRAPAVGDRWLFIAHTIEYPEGAYESMWQFDLAGREVQHTFGERTKVVATNDREPEAFVAALRRGLEERASSPLGPAICGER